MVHNEKSPFIPVPPQLASYRPKGNYYYHFQVYLIFFF